MSATGFSLSGFGVGSIRGVAMIIFILVGLLLAGQIFFGISGKIAETFPAPTGNTTIANAWTSFSTSVSSALQIANPLLLAAIGVVAIGLVMVIVRMIA